VTLLARNTALDKAQAASLQSLDGERFALDVVDRIPQEVICLEAHQ